MAESNQQLTKSESKSPEKVERTPRRPIFSPPVDILETPEEIIVRADLPGVDETSVECTLEAGILTIRGTARDDTPQELRLIDGEYVPGDFERVFELSEEINQEKIRASIRNGVLELRLPKGDQAKARKIEIKAE